jgi:polyhydroxyalkanoate synthesis repressor PhaR
MRLIRKQKNRRLYDTVDSRNVTLSELAEIIGSGESVRVQDGTSGEDLTRSVLLQIVLEQEGPGAAVLSQSFLESLIRLYNNPMQLLASGYLDGWLAGDTIGDSLTRGIALARLTASVRGPVRQDLSRELLAQALKTMAKPAQYEIPAAGAPA